MRSQSHQINDRVDRKILNIMQRLKSRFDPNAHKAKTEEMVQRMRRKQALEAKFNVQSSHDLISV